MDDEKEFEEKKEEASKKMGLEAKAKEAKKRTAMETYRELQMDKSTRDIKGSVHRRLFTRMLKPNLKSAEGVERDAAEARSPRERLRICAKHTDKKKGHQLGAPHMYIWVGLISALVKGAREVGRGECSCSYGPLRFLQGVVAPGPMRAGEVLSSRTHVPKRSYTTQLSHLRGSSDTGNKKAKITKRLENQVSWLP